jgi:hypothetical protein
VSNVYRKNCSVLLFFAAAFGIYSVVYFGTRLVEAISNEAALGVTMYLTVTVPVSAYFCPVRNHFSKMKRISFFNILINKAIESSFSALAPFSLLQKNKAECRVLVLQYVDIRSQNLI